MISIFIFTDIGILNIYFDSGILANCEAGGGDIQYSQDCGDSRICANVRNFNKSHFSADWQNHDYPRKSRLAGICAIPGNSKNINRQPICVNREIPAEGENVGARPFPKKIAFGPISSQNELAEARRPVLATCLGPKGISSSWAESQVVWPLANPLCFGWGGGGDSAALRARRSSGKYSSFRADQRSARHDSFAVARAVTVPSK